MGNYIRHKIMGCNYLSLSYSLINYVMPQSHCGDFCLQANSNWQTLRIHTIVFRCHFRIRSLRLMPMFWNVQNIRRGPANRSIFVWSLNTVSIRVSSCWFVSQHYTLIFVVDCTGMCLLTGAIQYIAIRCTEMAASYWLSHIHINWFTNNHGITSF